MWATQAPPLRRSSSGSQRTVLEVPLSVSECVCLCISLGPWMRHTLECDAWLVEDHVAGRVEDDIALDWVPGLIDML